jgi:ribosomal protein S18 acetylase RimI-like enzyme
VATLASAFHDVPIFRWFLPDEGRRAEILPAFFAAMVEAYTPWGEIHSAADGLAVAVWAPPGAAMPAAQATALAATLPAVLGEYGARMRELRPLLDAAHPTFPHWFLHFLAVRPEVQGQGHGSALLKPMLERADAEGIPAYLDATSEDNKRLYERNGFGVQQVLTLRDSPPLWSMLREAER